MKKSNFTRIISVVLSLALLLGAVLCVGVVAEEVSTEGKFGSISVSYGDKVFIRVKVNATEEEITAGETVVSYTLNGETKDATYYTDADEGVWVITEGIAAFDLAKEVVFNSYVGETQVEFNRTYSVAQYLYKMLYTDSGITAAIISISSVASS